MLFSYKAGQLLPERFEEAVKKASLDQTVKVNHREGKLQRRLCASARQSTKIMSLFFFTYTGYDHSYFFIQTFGPDHIAYHAKFLKA